MAASAGDETSDMNPDCRDFALFQVKFIFLKVVSFSRECWRDFSSLLFLLCTKAQCHAALPPIVEVLWIFVGENDGIHECLLVSYLTAICFS